MKHAMPMLSASSCFTCGKPWTTDAGAIQHPELPNIYACAECVAAIHASESRGSVPDGWVLVPREPTQAMLLAEDLALADDWDSNQFAWGRASWAAMLAASPTPAAVASGEPTKRMRITQRDGTSRVLPYDPQFVLDHDETMEVIDEATELARSAAAKGEG